MSNRTKILAALALAISAAFTIVPAASAATEADQPTRQQLLQQCESGKTDSCEFKPDGMEVINGPRQLAGSSTNCTNANQVRVIRWEAATTTTNTFGVEINAGVKLGKIFSASISSSYSREWSWSESKVDEIRQDVAKKSRVIIWASKQQVSVTGIWEIRFSKRYYGHYYWYVGGSVTGQTRGQAWDTRAEPVNVNC